MTAPTDRDPSSSLDPAALRAAAAGHLAAGRWQEARALCARLLRSAPGDLEGWHLAGLAAWQAGELDAAEACLTRAEKGRPDDVRLALDLARVLRARERYEAALPRIRRVLSVDADRAEPWFVLGLIEHGRGHVAAARTAYETAVARDPRHAMAHRLLGAARTRLGDRVGAIEAHRAAVAIEPDSPDAHTRLALALLEDGRLDEGWREYLWRATARRDPHARPAHPLPADLSGRAYRIVAEQGLGDVLFFLRFADSLVARGALVTHQPYPQLAGVLDRAPSIDLSAPPDRAVPVPAGDLPFLVGAEGRTAYPPPLALAADPARVDRVRADLRSETGADRLIGITWRAGTDGRMGPSRRAPLAPLLARLRSQAGRIVLLQRFPTAEELGEARAVLGPRCLDRSAANEDLEEMLALLAALDDYVTVSNTNLHLRAGLGRPSRVLVPHPVEYRWTGTDRSPWFPDCPTYRQDAAGSWREALDALARDLAEA